MGRCVVKGCMNYEGKKNGNENLKYFRFPKDETLLTQWIQACNFVNSKLNVHSARVCSDHFTQRDYKLEHILLKIPEKKKRLKKDAIPTINLSGENAPKGRGKRRKRYTKRKQRKKVEEYLEKPLEIVQAIVEDIPGDESSQDIQEELSDPLESDIEIETVPEDIPEDESNQNVQEELLIPLESSDVEIEAVPEDESIQEIQEELSNPLESDVEFEAVPEDISEDVSTQDIQEELSNLLGSDAKIKDIPRDESTHDIQEELSNSLESNVDLQTDVDPDCNRQLELENVYLKRQNRSLKIQRNKLLKRLQQAESTLTSIKGIFTNAQLEYLSNPRKKCNWTREDIDFAISLYSAGPVTYKLLLKRNYPLPAISCLRHQN